VDNKFENTLLWEQRYNSWTDRCQ